MGCDDSHITITQYPHRSTVTPEAAVRTPEAAISWRGPILARCRGAAERVVQEVWTVE